MKYYNLNKNFYDGFLYQIPLIPLVIPIEKKTEILNWVLEDEDKRRIRQGLHTTDWHKHYVELKNDTDLTYFLLRWS